MRAIINYLRQAFCKHEFEYEEVRYQNKFNGQVIREGNKIVRTCKKCGWHKSYWKY